MHTCGRMERFIADVFDCEMMVSMHSSTKAIRILSLSGMSRHTTYKRNLCVCVCARREFCIKWRKVSASRNKCSLINHMVGEFRQMLHALVTSLDILSKYY